MKQRYKITCIPFWRNMMGILQKEITLVGAKGRVRRTALFDSGASYSIICRDIAEMIDTPVPLPESESWEFETAQAGYIIRATERVLLNFYFPDSVQRFTDEFIVFEDCTEEVVIGVATMQKWSIKLDFEREEVLYRKTAQRLIVI
jgi:hypothetical protein